VCVCVCVCNTSFIWVNIFACPRGVYNNYNTAPFRTRGIQRDLSEWRTDFFRFRAPHARARMLRRDSLSLVIILRKLRRRRRGGKHISDDVTIMAHNTIIYTHTYRAHFYVYTHSIFILYTDWYIGIRARAVAAGFSSVCFVLCNPLESYKFFFFRFHFFLLTPPYHIKVSKNYNAYFIRVAYNILLL